MKIYTKVGDGGDTSLIGVKNISKASLIIEAVGTIDELSCIIGVSRSFKPHKQTDKILNTVQCNLYVFGADLANVRNKKINKSQISDNDILHLEKQINVATNKLKPLKGFVIPGGNKVSAMLHYARTVCRRAERLVVKLIAEEDRIDKIHIVYLNRLSDLLFVLAEVERR